MNHTCPKCEQLNTTLHWWHDEPNNRWICYPCGMGRRKEQNRIEAQWKQQYDTAPST